MSAARDLPARPSLDSLRKQAKRLARDADAGNPEAVARVHAQLPQATPPLSHRDAQLVIAREYGFAGWPDLTAEVEKRVGRGLEWAVSRAKVAIHDNTRSYWPSEKPYYLLAAGDTYNMRTRKVVNYADRRHWPSTSEPTATASPRTLSGGVVHASRSAAIAGDRHSQVVRCFVFQS